MRWAFKGPNWEAFGAWRKGQAAEHTGSGEREVQHAFKTPRSWKARSFDPQRLLCAGQVLPLVRAACGWSSRPPAWRHLDAGAR